MDIYRHVGGKVRNDLQRRGLPESRWVCGSGLGCGYAYCRLSAIMERFDEVDLSGRQVPSNDSLAPSGSHDSSSHDAKLHDAITPSATKQLPVGKPPIGGVSKIDRHRVTGMFSL